MISFFDFFRHENCKALVMGQHNPATLLFQHVRTMRVGFIISLVATVIILTPAMAISQNAPITTGPPPESHTSIQGRSIRYQSIVVDKRVYHAVIADLSSSRVKAEMVHAPRMTKPWEMISWGQPAAAITGTFFAFETQQPVADVLVDGKLVVKGNRGSGVAVDWFGGITIFDQQFQRSTDWSGYRHGLRGAVRLIQNGKVNPNPQAQAFRDPAIWGSAARTGVGLTSDNELVFFSTPHAVTLSQFGNAMRELNVVNAVSLDGGSSTMLYYRGKMVISSKRRLTNMLILHERSPFDDTFRLFVEQNRVAASR